MAETNLRADSGRTLLHRPSFWTWRAALQTTGEGRWHVVAQLAADARWQLQ